MIRSIKHIFRNFKKNPVLLFVNIPGLSLGLSAFLLLMFLLIHELSFDKVFPNKERIVRLYNILTEKNTVDALPICLREAYTELPSQVPEIESTVQIYRGWKTNINYKQTKILSQDLLYADSTFFKVFGLNLLSGNVETALKDKYSAVITQNLAQKLFGNNPAIGKHIKVDDENYTVTRIIKKLPATTHFNFDVLTSMSSTNLDILQGLEFFTYYLLKKETDRQAAYDKITQLNNKIVKDKFKDFELSLKVNSGVESLKQIHLHTVADFDLSKKGNPKVIYIIAFLAFFILLIAIVNHINLFVLHGEKRFKEIGIRKTLGAGKSSLVSMFYLETVVITAISFILAFLLSRIALPYFALLMNKKLIFSEMMSFYTVASMLIFMLILVIVSGAYPALYLSKLKIISAVKGDMQSIKRKKMLPVISVLVQFSISIFLIFNLLIMYYQISFLKNIPLGFSPDNIIAVSGFGETINKKSISIVNELKKLPFVNNVASSTHAMGGGCSGQLITEYGKAEDDDWQSINEYRVQAGFCKTMKMHLISGRFFNNTEADKSSIILNEAAVKMLNLKDPIGKKMIMFDEPLTIIGIIKNFYYTGNSGEKIAPLVLTNYSDWVNNFYLRTKHQLSNNEMQQIKNIFNGFDPEYQFYTYRLKDSYLRKFNNEDRVVKLLFYATLLAVFLCITGMFALAVFNVERRIKEIGIRKVLGASSKLILTLLLTKMLQWVVWAMIPSLLIGYILMNDWLQNFTNKININILYFIISGGLAVIIAIVAVSAQSIWAATRNPVDSLRYE
ncbi:MAG: ABC transporter permease [Bacteroidales bacterium]|nr:ABC transporter permease [Bacteroidales bacterium]